MLWICGKVTRGLSLIPAVGELLSEPSTGKLICALSLWRLAAASGRSLRGRLPYKDLALLHACPSTPVWSSPCLWRNREPAE